MGEQCLGARSRAFVQFHDFSFGVSGLWKSDHAAAALLRMAITATSSRDLVVILLLSAQTERVDFDAKFVMRTAKFCREHLAPTKPKLFLPQVNQSLAPFFVPRGHVRISILCRDKRSGTRAVTPSGIYFGDTTGDMPTANTPRGSIWRAPPSRPTRTPSPPTPRIPRHNISVGHHA